MDEKYLELCKQVLEHVGGVDNIISVSHCATRLRINPKDKSLIDVEKVQEIDGVIGTRFSADQFQIIIGQHVSKVCDTFIAYTGIDSAKSNLEYQEQVKTKITPKTLVNMALETLAACLTPLFPIFIGAGIIKMIVVIIGPDIFNLVSADSDLYVLLNFVGDAGFYYFPIFAAWTAAKRFGASIPVSMFLASIMLHPALMGIVEAGNPFTVYGIPMTLVNYSSQFLPVLFTIWMLSKVQKYIEKYLPEVLHVAFMPVLSVLIMLPFMLCLFGPFGTEVGIIIGAAGTFLSDKLGPLAIGFFGGTYYFIIAFGMGYALFPIIMNALTTQGYDNLFWLSAIIATYALIGVVCGYVIRCKKEERGLAWSYAITLMLGGISEPLLYGVILRFRKAMKYLFLGGFVGGVFASLFSVKAYALGAGNILFFTVFAGGGKSNLIYGMICCAIAFTISFVLAVLFGFEEGKSDKLSEDEEQGVVNIYKPLEGEVIPIEEVNDVVFSEKQMGDGIAIVPSAGKLRSPINGEVVALFPTNHAVGIKADNGLEIMIHIGIDTVNLGGEGFKAHTKVGDKVKQGDLLVEFDLEKLTKMDYDLTTSVIVVSESKEINKYNEQEDGIVMCVQN